MGTDEGANIANRLKCASENVEKSLHCLAQHIEGFERSKLNLDRLNLTQTHAIAHALAATVIRLSTNIIWVE